MKNKLIILGSGAAPGVPSLGSGFNQCNPENLKNIRMRTSTYLEFSGIKLLIDTSPDLRTQLINQNIRDIDGVLYSHSHADHLNGIDDLREINRINRQSLNFYAGKQTTKDIQKRFSYLIASKKTTNNVILRPSLVANVVKANHPFYILHRNCSIQNNGIPMSLIQMIGRNNRLKCISPEISPLNITLHVYPDISIFIKYPCKYLFILLMPYDAPVIIVKWGVSVSSRER